MSSSDSDLLRELLKDMVDPNFGAMVMLNKWPGERERRVWPYLWEAYKNSKAIFDVLGIEVDTFTVTNAHTGDRSIGIRLETDYKIFRIGEPHD